MRCLTSLLSLLLLAAVFGSPLPAKAVQPDEMLSNPIAEKRAQALGRELRCLVCQSESIEGSNAGLAKDLRVLVRQKIEEGLTDQEIKDFLVARYGVYVLMSPPVEGSTLWLWLAPGILLLMGSAGIVVFVRQRNQPKVEEPAQAARLTPDEVARLKALEEGPREG